MEVRFFGEFEAVEGGVPVPVRGAKQRTVLALLALHRGKPVSADRLIDALWGDGQVANPVNALQAQIGQLRRTLGATAILTSDAGYALDIGPDDVDAARFEQLVAKGRRLLEEGEMALASTALGEALRLRRGEPLAEFAYAGFADAERAHLAELTLVAIETRAEAGLVLGRHGELVGELEALCREHPLRERLWELLMLALYRAGRQAEALGAYTEARDRLVRQLGIDPGPALRELEARILAQDPSLAAAGPAGLAAVPTPMRDVLLATKLHMPVSRPGLVPRPRLAGRLDEGLARGLTLVCASAGYGKTVLLADWARRGEHPVAWLSLDVGDNDPARFWRHAVAALDRARPGIAERVAPLLGPPAPSSFQGLVTALINEVASNEALLVLDDYHVISAQQVHESLAFLLEHRPAGICVVLASRSDPPLALARLRARGQLTEVRAVDLRFTLAEAATLLQQDTAALPEESVAALAARTEGWAAGLQLAALSLRGQDDVAGFVAKFTGSNRYILDYLAEEVLERQDEQVRTFLLETSVLDRLSGPLCDAVTGNTGSQALLEQVERAGLFLVPLDEVRGWWRYHHLFADLLRTRLEQQPGRAEQLHCNAATWYAEHGLADDAIRHAAAAGEMTWAARLIEQHFDELFYLRGEGATVQRWLSALPDDLVRSRPRLLLAQAQLAAATSGRVEAAEQLLDAAECASASAADEPFEPTADRAGSLLANIAAGIALLRSYLAALRGNAEGTAAFASQTLAELSEGEQMLSSIAQCNLGIAEWLRGRLADAERAFVSGIAGWRAASQYTVAAWGCYHLVQVQRAQGRLDAAARTCQQALDAITAPARFPLPTAGPAYVGLGEVAYQRNELDTAFRHASEGIALCRQFADLRALAAGLATLAWIRQASGDPAGAREAIGEARKAGPGPAGLLNPVPAQHARLLLAQGNLTEAARWTTEGGLSADDEPDYPREGGHLVLARVLLAQGEAERALALLGRLRAAAAAQDRAGSLIEIGALRALALAARGEERAAVDALAGALVIACPQGYVRVFADEGPPMAALLGRLITAQRTGQAAADIPLGYLARLQRAFDTGHPATEPGPAAVSGIVDPLTSRELEVLRMLAAGRSNQAIARELVVTLDTVKKHVGHVLGKLGAANRTEAVARARELSLIP